MKIHPVLLFCFLSVLQDGNIGLINAKLPSFTKTEGQNITVPCNFTETGDRRYFCKHKSEERTSPKLYNDCVQAERILEMDGVSAQRGRYSMRYKTTRTGSRLYVTITHLNKSDSGRYTCALDKFFIDPYQEFKIIVTDGPSTSTPKMTTRPFLTSAPSASTTTTTTTQSFRRSTEPSSSPKTTNRQQTETTTGGNILYVAVSVTGVVVLLAVFLPLLYKCIKRKSSSDLNSRVYLTDTNMESVIYENCAKVSKLAEPVYENYNPSSTYETLNTTTMAHDVYSTLGQQI
ncbi:uncharacterized protein LOC133987202 [Scomber scombrus]|uniref:uncharacterized protein LOC133987202 n=1 Tax=Scomber scombrus TaxID=13677 RepID=UPI002DDA8435|nr:uncharacterized protein LOC133987202 [Scomber scombrus]